MDAVNVRYIVNDVADAIAFYRQLGFDVDANPAPGFAMLSNGNLRLLLNTPEGGGGAGRRTSDGRLPEPGGWNRIQLPVEDLDGHVQALRQAGVVLRGEIVTGKGGRQILVDDPSGNPVELFEPAP